METPETHIQKILEAIQLFKKHDTSITLPPDKWVSVFSVMEEYASIRAEQARREERGKIKSEMENLKFTAEDMAEFAEWFSRNWDLDFKADLGLEVWLKERESK